ncbi:MAG TPA: ATP-binding cassette domain-containing protein, partial [Kofleriaceae bacterium]|nr:ATP-binding cassette domain-containing protein [Kofleriaceae bacterium]
MTALVDATISKRFPRCEVLRAARIAIEPGTVHALVGENGAGKTTLVKILSGVLAADGGALAIDGRAVPLRTWNRAAARAAGIGIVQQHGAFAGTLSVVENAVLGIEPHRGPLLELAPTARALEALGAKVGLPIDPWARTADLSLGAAQRAEIVSALQQGAKLLVLDEPTAVLAPVEVDGLLATLRALAAAGTTIVIVTHKLDEVRAVADDVTVLRAGETVATFSTRPVGGPARTLDVGAIARAMVGAELAAATSVPAPAADARDALVLERIGVRGALHDIDLRVRAGEIVGIAGVDGNGQRELALAIAGLVAHAGRVRIGERDVSSASTRARLAAGLAHVPEDRQHGGLVLDASIADNVSLARADITGRYFIDRARVAAFADEQIAALDIRPTDRDAIVRTLSGGNQQKVVIARELSRPALTAIVAAQPTRGVDLGAVVRIHAQLRAAAARGAGLLVISADLDELLGLCHRIVVLLRGRLVGERAGEALHGSDARAAIGALMTGA